MKCQSLVIFLNIHNCLYNYNCVSPLLRTLSHSLLHSSDVICNLLFSHFHGVKFYTSGDMERSPVVKPCAEWSCQWEWYEVPWVEVLRVASSSVELSGLLFAPRSDKDDRNAAGPCGALLGMKAQEEWVVEWKYNGKMSWRSNTSAIYGQFSWTVWYFHWYIFFLISRLIEPILFLLSVQLSETIKVVVQANQRTLLI